MPTNLSPSTCDFLMVPLWFTCALLVGSFTVWLVCWVVSGLQSKWQVHGRLMIASNSVLVERKPRQIACDATVLRKREGGQESRAQYVRKRATEKSSGSEKTAGRVVLSVSETSSGRAGRSPNAVAEDVTRDGLQYCATRRPGPTG